MLAITRTGVGAVPDNTLAVTKPSEFVTPDSDTSDKPPAVLLKLKSTSCCAKTLSNSLFTKKVKVDDSFLSWPPVPFKTIDSGIALTNSIEATLSGEIDTGTEAWYSSELMVIVARIISSLPDAVAQLRS